MEGLNQLLRQKYDPDYESEAAKEAKIEATALMAENFLKDKKGKMKLDELLKCSLGK